MKANKFRSCAFLGLISMCLGQTGPCGTPNPTGGGQGVDTGGEDVLDPGGTGEGDGQIVAECTSDRDCLEESACEGGECVPDADGDGIPDARDACPEDPNKAEPGACGCGIAETPICGETITLALGGGVTMELVRIPAGTFMMGSDNGSGDETPVHSVTISQDFYIGKYEVTQAQWQAVMGTTPSSIGGCFGCPPVSGRPVETVSWDDAVAFNAALSSSTGYGIRLPTEAEWEYAARAGTDTEYSFGDSADNLGNYAWYRSNSVSRTHVVGGKLPNAWGLYDMHGNVWEWCNDWYYGTYYGVSPSTDPTGPGLATTRVVRGGAWGKIPYDCRSAYRGEVTPGSRGNALGFRVAAGT